MASEEICARLELLAAWRKPSGQTPSEKMPNTYKTVTAALAHVRAQDAEINTKADFIEATVNQLAIAEDRIKRLETALRGIAIEAERENGAWVHLKRVIGLNVRAALEETHDRG